MHPVVYARVGFFREPRLLQGHIGPFGDGCPVVVAVLVGTWCWESGAKRAKGLGFERDTFQLGGRMPTTVKEQNAATLSNVEILLDGPPLFV